MTVSTYKDIDMLPSYKFSGRQMIKGNPIMYCNALAWKIGARAQS